MKSSYTDTDNELIWENWWNPEARATLPSLLNRTMKALSVHFYTHILRKRKVKAKDYYKLMEAKYSTTQVQEIPPVEIPQTPEEPPRDLRVDELEEKVRLLTSYVETLTTEFVASLAIITELIKRREVIVNTYARTIQSADEKLLDELLKARNSLRARTDQFGSVIGVQRKGG